MLSILRKAWILGVSAALVACGGGGGNAGTSPFPGDGGGTGGSTVTYSVAVAVQRSGVAVSSITSTETVQAVATVKDSGNNPVSGVVVTFAQAGATLLQFAPSSATALTNSDGVATLEVSAQSVTSTGATSVTASADVAGASVSSSAALEIKAGAVSETPITPAAINFVSVTPSGTAIVIKGAGGNGRTESASLTFKVVDTSGAPVQGATVNFSVNPSNVVTLNVPSAVSNADGLVTTTVQSGTQATSVVVRAVAAADTTVTGQSDTLVVSNGAAIVTGIEIAAAKYNLDGLKTGDSTTITAYVRDANGNPVPDGVAVSFTTDYGVIATSDLGGCLTVNGNCTVDFRVQDPRGTGVATVSATVRVNDQLLGPYSIQINMAGANGGYLRALDDLGAELSVLEMSSCKQTFELLLSDSEDNHAPPAGTVIALDTASSGVSVSVRSGTPVLDQLASGFPPVAFSIEVDTGTISPACNATGTVKDGGFVTLKYTTPGGIKYSDRFTLRYPQ